MNICATSSRRQLSCDSRAAVTEAKHQIQRHHARATFLLTLGSCAISGAAEGRCQARPCQLPAPRRAACAAPAAWSGRAACGRRHHVSNTAKHACVQLRAGHSLFAILFRLHVRAQCRCVLKVPPAAAQKPPLSRGLHTAATTHRRTQSRRSKTGPCPASLRQAAAACSAASAVRTLARAHAAASAAYFNLCRRVESLPHQVRRC